MRAHAPRRTAATGAPLCLVGPSPRRAHRPQRQGGALRGHAQALEAAAMPPAHRPPLAPRPRQLPPRRHPLRRPQPACLLAPPPSRRKCWTPQRLAHPARWLLAGLSMMTTHAGRRLCYGRTSCSGLRSMRSAREGSLVHAQISTSPRRERWRQQRSATGFPCRRRSRAQPPFRLRWLRQRHRPRRWAAPQSTSGSRSGCSRRSCRRARG
mmetsp:Transcript_62707/g.158373  ORF Transcript_62707/g.158373 Transcript_62707/m.158373 type:complete len:210 (-) Transcript_62707:160-789(-)